AAYYIPAVAVTYPRFFESGWTLAAIILISLTCIIGMFYVQQNFRRQLVQGRKSWNLIFLYLAISLFVPLINATHSFVYWMLCAVPVAVISAAGFLYPGKKWFPLIVHWLMVAFVIAFSYFVK
ncbi:MAG: hypothetical protein ABIS01_08845, partial [Ferruginibacter sp.]